MTDLPCRDAFDLPEGLIYLDGNSLGPLPWAARARIEQTIDAEWGQMLIRGWNQAGWMDLPGKVGDRIGRLIGAPAGSVMAGDTTSLNVFKAVSAALVLSPGRKVVLSDSGNFPTDLYVVQGLLQGLGKGHQLRLVAPEHVGDELGEELAVLMLTEVDYRTGRRHDMAALSEAARARGIVTIWDLAHSVGAFPVDVTGAGADFAVGCGYKYLNGGPGAPAFIYVRPGLADRVDPMLRGWMGHDAPFDFDLAYRPGPGIDRMRVGTPPVLGLSVLDAALELWDDIDMTALRARSIALCDRFIAEVETRCAGQGLTLASPRDPALRGSQVSFHCPNGYAVMQALIADDVIGDFRAPDLIRFGFAPLYNSEDEIVEAARRLSVILSERRWDRPDFLTRAKVT